MLKALVVDDEYLVRMGIRETIDWASHGIEIIGEADNGADGLSLAMQHKPDVIVTDIRMPYMNGIEFIEKIKENRLNAGIIVLSGYDEFQYAQAAIRHGASSYLLKPVDTDELAASVRAIGLEAQARLRDRDYYGQLKSELPAISRQFWLDLLHGRIRQEEEIAGKRQLLGLDMRPGYITAVVLEPKDKTASPSASGSALIEESTVGAELKAHSLHTEAVVPSGPGQWTVVLKVTDEWNETLGRIRAFGYGLASRAKQAGEPELASGIGRPATKLAELNASYGSAVEAVQKAAASIGGVWYAEDADEMATRREIRGALAYIRRHYAESITVEKVAAEVFVSPTHLMHLFRKELNKTFYECLTECRIEEAKLMLRDPRYRVYEVSDRVGFGDAKYFSQIFKKMTGMTPSEYARTEG